MRSTEKPVLFLLPQIYSVHQPSLIALNRRRPIEIAIFESRQHHGGGVASAEALPFPVRTIRQREARALARRSDFGAVVIDARGRLVFPSVTLDRSRNSPLIFWSTLWEFPQTAPWMIGRQLVKRTYRTADAVVTPGPHVTAKAGAYGADAIWEAFPNVDSEFWSETVEPERDCEIEALFVGRMINEKGCDILVEAWNRSGVGSDGGRLRLVGTRDQSQGSSWVPHQTDPSIELILDADNERLRRIQAGSDFLIAPSIRTAKFSEDWGMATSEAMMAGTVVIASDRVGAAAAGLIRDGETGLVVESGKVDQLASAIQRLASDAALRKSLARAGREAVLANTPEAWAEQMDQAIGYALDRRKNG